MLEEKLDVKVYQVALHRDEGYIDEKGKKHINYHGHILFSGLDSEGRAIKRNKLNIHVLKQLQTEVAKILNMERGQPSKSKRKHLDIYTYKQIKKQEAELIKELKKDIKLDNKKINKYLKIINKKLSELTNVFGNVKKEDALDLFKKVFKSLKVENKKLEEENKELKQKLSEKNFKLHELEFDYEKFKQENKELFNRILEFKQADTYKLLEENKTLKKENEELKEENKNLKITLKDLKAEISDLRAKMIQINKNQEKQEKEKIFDKEDYQYLSKLKKELKTDTIKEIYEKLQEYKKQINKKAKERGIDF
jgi:chromosome segregation ATPase